MSPLPSSPIILSTRETFLPLPENRLAWAAVEELAQHDASRDGRLVYISGPSGVGKTLLVRELLRTLHTSQEKRASLTASQWSAEMTEASQQHTMDVFQKKYRSMELLICEDITAIAGRKQSQQQLALAIDEILANSGRVLITSNTTAGNLARFSRRLVNRFHGGVTASISLPDFDSRVKLLNHFAAAGQIPLSQPVAELLADGLPVSPRELQATLNQLETQARRQDLPLTVKLAEQFLDREPAPQTTTLSEVASAVARQFGVPLSGLRGKKRVHGVVLPRQCAMFLARELTDQSLLAIAQFFGRRHHSTVVHACKRMETALSSEPALRQHLAQIRTALGSQA